MNKVQRRGDAEMKTVARVLMVMAVIVVFAATMSAQQIGSPTSQQGVTPPRGTFVIRNARIVTVSGADIENGSIVIRDGKIEAVGATVSAPSGSQTIDGHGLSVYPGMIDAGTSMGLVEVPQGADVLSTLPKLGEFNPNSRAIIAVNPQRSYCRNAC